jgi:hypothetical protein
MVIVFVHGWSVRNTNTYGQLPARLKKSFQSAGKDIRVENVYLGQYISFDDAVTLDDIARAFDFALREKLFDAGKKQWTKFACITHSTGGPVVRLWMDLFYGKDHLAACPMSHLVMLAPANHGSALAQLGKSRLSRIKSLFEGAEPGTGVLDWLELGSNLTWDLNTRTLEHDYAAAGVWVFTLTGQKIDRSLYDHLNSYTGEPGSDGVVRAAAANLNYQLVRLVQKGKRLVLDAQQQTRPTAMGILPGRAHSGTNIGIIRSVKATGDHPTLTWVSRCLGVEDATGYAAVARELSDLTAQTQKDERLEVVEKRFLPDQKYYTYRYSMVIFRLRNDRGAFLSNYDLILTAGPDYSPDDLPTDFFVDRQRNLLNLGQLTYYLNYDALDKLRRGGGEGRIGFKINARPNQGLAFYQVAEFQSDTSGVRQFFRPNETTLVDILITRKVDARVFRLSEKLPRGDKGEEISKEPMGSIVP